MERSRDDQPIVELDLLRPPQRSETARSSARRRIAAAAEQLLKRRRRPASSWEVLASWARPGLVAATIALLLLAGALQLARSGRTGPAPLALEDVLTPNGSSQVPALLLAVNEPDADALVAAALAEPSGETGRVLKDGEGQ